VIFIDDLDRCRPDKALEVLESIKSFFDIEGIVYVIGMDSQSINPLVKRKYGKHVKGLDYSQKIVQLPFQIPTWKPTDMYVFIDRMISKGLGALQLVQEFKNYNPLIVKSVESNPREVKRFINNIILAESVFKKPIDELIVVQALRFRPEWNTFLELITPDDDERKTFLNEYKRLSEKVKTTTTSNRDEIIKEFSEARDDFPLFRDILDPDALKRGDALSVFLDAGGLEVLLRIEKMEEYRRALASVEHKPIEEASSSYFEEKVKEYNKLRIVTSGDSCDDLLWNHVIGKERKKVVARCITVSGIIIQVRPQRSLSYSVGLNPDPKFVNLITPANLKYRGGHLVLRVYRPNSVIQSETSSYFCSMCGKSHQNIIIPPLGTHVSVTGSYVLDPGHGWWAEINPVTTISAIS